MAEAKQDNNNDKFDKEKIDKMTLTERAVLWMNTVPTKTVKSDYLCLVSENNKFVSDAFPDRKTAIEYGEMMHGGIFPSLPDFDMKFPIKFQGKNEGDNKDVVCLLEMGFATFKGEDAFGVSATNKESNWACVWLFVFDANKKIETIYKGFDMANVCRNFGWPSSAIFPNEKQDEQK